MKRILPVFLLVNLMFPACAPVSVPTSTLTPAPGVTPLLTPTAPPTGTATPTETPTATPQPTETPEQNPTTTEELIGVLAEKLGGGIEWSGADVYPQYFDPIRHNIILTESVGGQQKSAVAENPVWKKYDPNTPGKAFHLLLEFRQMSPMQAKIDFGSRQMAHIWCISAVLIPYMGSHTTGFRFV